MPEIQYPKNPNSDTAFVVQEDGTKNRALMTAPQDTSTLELPSNANSTKGYVTIDGKKQRVILTADIGGGGGGSVDKNTIINKATSLPTPSANNLGQVYMYDGESNALYTHGYIYQVVAEQTASAVEFSGNIITSWAVADFVRYLQEGGSNYNEVVSGTLTYDSVGGLWVLVGYDTNGIKVFQFQEYTEDLVLFGCTFASETHQDGDTCTFTLTTTASGYKWTRVDVQPAPEAVKVNTTAALAVADWSLDTQTVTVSGVKADSVVFVSPDPTSASDYASAGILCTSQSADSLTFTATTTPSVAIVVNVVCL